MGLSAGAAEDEHVPMKKISLLLALATICASFGISTASAKPSAASRSHKIPFDLHDAPGLPPDVNAPSEPGAYRSRRLLGGARGPLAVAQGTTAYVPVLLVDFSDIEAQRDVHTPEMWNRIMFEDDAGIGAGSFRDYWQDQSGGLFDVTGDVTPWLRMPLTHSAYVGSKRGYQTTEPNDWTLTRDAVAAADAYINFCRADGNGDGNAETVFVVHAGTSAEETGSGLQSLKWQLPSPYTTQDTCSNGSRARVSTFVLAPERYAAERFGAPGAPPHMATIGTLVHEFGHVLGLPDLYDLDYSSTGGVGTWDVMAYGTWGFTGSRPWRPAPLSAWTKTELGWALPRVVTSNMLAVTLPSADVVREGMFHGVYKLVPGGGSSGSEYFLVENRTATGWGADMPTPGLAIWHVDESSRPTRNNDPTNTGRRLLTLEQADGYDELGGAWYQPSDEGDLFPGSSGKRRFDATTVPNSNLYSGAASDIAVRRIGNPGATITADLLVAASSAAPVEDPPDDPVIEDDPLIDLPEDPTADDRPNATIEALRVTRGSLLSGDAGAADKRDGRAVVVRSERHKGAHRLALVVTFSAPAAPRGVSLTAMTTGVVRIAIRDPETDKWVRGGEVRLSPGTERTLPLDVLSGILDGPWDSATTARVKLSAVRETRFKHAFDAADLVL